MAKFAEEPQKEPKGSADPSEQEEPLYKRIDAPGFLRNTTAGPDAGQIILIESERKKG